MRERAEELGGSLSVADTHPGVRVEAQLPVGAATAAAEPTRAVPA